MAKVFLLGDPAQLPLPDFEGNVLLLAVNPVGKAKAVIFKVAKFDPSKHPKGAKGLFIETPDKVKATNAVPGSVIATKSGKVFQVSKQTEKGVKVTPVDIHSGEVKQGYTVLGNDVDVAVVEKAYGPGTVDEIQNMPVGTVIKTKAGKRFKVHKHGKWTTVYPVDDSGEVAGKHTVLQPGVLATVDAPAVGGEVTAKQVSAIDALTKALHGAPGMVDDPTHEVGPLAFTPDNQALKGELAVALLGPLKDWFGEYGHDESDEDVSFWVNHILGDGLSFPGDGPTFAAQFMDAAGFEQTSQAAQDDLEKLYESALAAAHSEVEDAAPEELPALPMPKLTGAAAVAEFNYHLGDAIKPLFAGGDEETAEHTPYTLIEDALLNMGTLGKLELPPNTDAAYAEFKDTLGGQFDSYGFHGEALWEAETDSLLKAAWDNAFATIGLPYAEPPKPMKKQVVQETMPTKLPKVPSPYPPGVGKDTEIEIRTVGTSFFSVFRAFPDGRREPLGAADTRARALKLARGSSASHEPINLVDFEYPNAVTHNLGLISAGKLVPGTRVALLGGQVYEIESVGTKPKPHYMASALGDVLPDIKVRLVNDHAEQAPPRDMSLSAMVILPEGTEIDLSHGHYSTSTIANRAESLLLFEKQAGIKPTQTEVLRKAHPEKYTPYLQPDWNPDELVGKGVSDALKALGKLGYREIKPRRKEYAQVINMFGRRLRLHRDGNNVASVEASTTLMGIGEGEAHDYSRQLQEVLDTGGDLSPLDPRTSAAVLDRTNHVRQLLFDMAVGKRNGVAAAIGKTKQKVKSDAAYLAEIESEGKIGSVEDFKQQVDRPPLKLGARGSVIFAWGLKDDPRWDFDNRLFTPPPDLDDPKELAALQSILRHEGVSEYMRGAPHEETDIVSAAKKLAGLDLPSLAAPDSTKEYISTTVSANYQIVQGKLAAVEDEWAARANNLRAASVQDEIVERRKAEGTVAEATAAGEFDLPIWEEVEFEAQSFDDIGQLAAEIGTTPTDVPGFYKGGVVRDGVLQHRAQETWGRVDLDLDGYVAQQLEAAGAIREGNRNPIDPGYQGSGKLYNGEQITLTSDNQAPVDDDPFPKPGDVWTDGSNFYRVKEITGISVEVGMLSTTPGQETFDGTEIEFSTFKHPLQKFQTTETHDGDPTTLTRAFRPASLGERRIEYVPHDQPPGNAGGAPTSQRGRLTLIGYSPEEAARKLQQLGLLGELEPEVPFKVLLRSTRRYGHPAPIHPAYVRGEAPLPRTPARITHGITNTSNGGAVETAKAILRSGGLMSIWERHRHGMLKQTKGVSIAGDIRSGIDHGVFCTLNSGGACGSGAQIKFVMKPSAFLRRDILLAPHDFGGCDTRYPQYKSYLNKLQQQVGVAKTNLYDPIDPKARQAHLDAVSVDSSTEYNTSPTIPIEDMEAIQVPDDASKAQIEAVLDDMLQSGHIASKPRVVLADEGDQLAKKKTEGTEPVAVVGGYTKGQVVLIGGVAHDVIDVDPITDVITLQALGKHPVKHTPTQLANVMAAFAGSNWGPEGDQYMSPTGTTWTVVAHDTEAGTYTLTSNSSAETIVPVSDLAEWTKV